MQLDLKDMTLEQKLGFVMCARVVYGMPDPDFVLEMVRKRAVGCIQIPTQDREFVEKVRACADYPILIINDAEQGFPASKLPKVQQMTLAATADEEAVRAFAKGIVHDAQETGFNAAWGPLLDVLRCDGPCKVHRVFSDDPQVVTRYAEIMNEVMVQNHFLGTGKHYPGQGGMVMDTHVGEDRIDVSRDELLEFDLKPYLQLMEKGLLRAIMTTHSTFPQIDPVYPASLSKKVIDVIREKGFDGLCFTDSFAMMSILQQYGEENIYGMALAAGNDLILPNFRGSHRKALEMLRKNFEDGMFSQERLDEAVRRVLEAQVFVAGQDGICEFTPQDRKVLEGVAQTCITAVTDPGVASALSDQQRLFVVMTGMDFEEGAEVATGIWYDPGRVAKAVEQNFPGSQVHFFPEFPTSKDVERMLVQATKYREVVFVTFCTTSPYIGTDGLTRRAEAAINSLIDARKMAAVVHFGNPLAVENLHHVPRMFFGYMMQQSQFSAMEALAGKFVPTGKLPFQVVLP